MVLVIIFIRGLFSDRDVAAVKGDDNMKRPHEHGAGAHAAATPRPALNFAFEWHKEEKAPQRKGLGHKKEAEEILL